MRTRTRHNGRRVAVAFVCAFAAAPAAAQQAPLTTPPAIADDLRGTVPDSPLSPEDEALLRNVLAFDPAQIGIDSPVKPFNPPGRKPEKGLDVARTDRPDGGSTVVVNQPFATDWDSKVGVDLTRNVAVSSRDPVTNPLNSTKDDSGSGAAFASLSVPQFATVDARVDPSGDSGHLGTKFTRSLPVGEKLAVTFESGVSVTENFGQPQPTALDVPLMVAPVSVTGEQTPHVFGQQNVAKLDILPSGTTLAAGVSTSSTDPVTHNSLSAEQKLYGPLHVTTAVNDIGQASESKSISAAFKLTW